MMLLKAKGKTRTLQFLQEHHFLFIERPFQEAADKILLWGWSEWWPHDNPLQYTLVTDGRIPAVGEACKASLGGRVLRAVFRGEVLQFKPQRVLQMEWRSGMMSGQEFVLVEERSNGIRIDHRVRYKGTNILTHLLWVLCFRKKYRRCVIGAFEAMRRYFEEQERHWIDDAKGVRQHG